MANKQQLANSSAVDQMAAELFARFWTPNYPKTVEGLVDEVYTAAEAFYAGAEKRKQTEK